MYARAGGAVVREARGGDWQLARRGSTCGMWRRCRQGFGRGAWCDLRRRPARRTWRPMLRDLVLGDPALVERLVARALLAALVPLALLALAAFWLAWQEGGCSLARPPEGTPAELVELYDRNPEAPLRP